MPLSTSSEMALAMIWLRIWKAILVTLPKSAKYAQILKNSVAFKEIANDRIFLMKDLAAVEEAARLGAKIVEYEVAFW
jgi:hypothetical protein